MSYALDVRHNCPPHEVLGQLVVPYEATIGEMPYVTFEERKGWGPRVYVYKPRSAR